MTEEKKKLDRPVPAGEVTDENGLLIGRYIYLESGDQSILDEFCTSWLRTYDRDNNFFITLDLETTGLKPHEGKILLVSISWDGKNSIIFCPEYFNLDLFKEVLNTIPINNHNIKFDLKWLGYHYGTESKVFLDTMVGAQLGWAGVFPQVPQGTFGLSNVAKHLLEGYKLEKETRNEFIGMKLEDGFTRKQIEYAVKDSLITHKLVYPIIKRLTNQDLMSVWEEIERPLIEILVRTELKGVKINVDEVERLLSSKEKNLAEAYDTIKKYVEEIPSGLLPTFPKGVFNPGSSQQVVAVLNALGMKPTNTQKSTLQTLQAETGHPLLEAIIEWKQLKSIISKFLTKWLTEHIDFETNSIYTSYNTYGAETGRLSCKEPNMQQIPGDLRSMIIARDDYKIISMDYSQFEFRAAAAVTGEEYLVDAFVERAALLPKVVELANSHGYIDPDAFVKDAGKEKVNLTLGEKALVHDFALTDIHRRNAALILGKNVSDITPKERGIGKCVSLDTYVHTNKGIKKVGDFLPAKRKADTFYDLKGVKVLTDQGYRDAPTIYFSGKKETLKIVADNGMSLVCTPQHRFRSMDKHGKYVWVTASKLRLGQEIFVKGGEAFDTLKPKSLPLGLKTVEQMQALASITGMYLIAGSTTETVVSLPSFFEAKLKTALDTCAVFGKYKINGPTKKDETLYIHIPELAKWLKGIGTVIPNIFLNETNAKVLGALLSPMAVSCNTGYQFSTDNAPLLRQIQNCLIRLGLFPWYLHKNHTMIGLPSLTFSTEDQYKLQELLFGIKNTYSESPFYKFKKHSCNKTHNKLIEASLFESKYSNDKELVEGVLTPEEIELSKFFLENNILKVRVYAIHAGEKLEVADFSVPDNSTVVYEGFVTHNTLGYAVLYGAGANRVQESLAKEGFYHTMAECKIFLEEFFNKLPKIKNFIDEVHAKVVEPGHITTVVGRKRFFELPPKFLTRKYEMELNSSYREATNFCFQAANADATKLAMVKIDEVFRKYPEDVRPVILLTVHDEIVVEAHKSNYTEVVNLGKAIMIDCGMQSTLNQVPIEVSQSIGDHWQK